MRCKICGSNVDDNADYCPDCGKTIRRPAGEFPQRKPSGVPYPSARPSAPAFKAPRREYQAPPPEFQAPPRPAERPAEAPRYEAPAPVPREERAPERREKKRGGEPFDANLFFSLAAALLLLACSFGTILSDIVRLHYDSQPESVYTGVSYSMGYSSLMKDGFSEFFENEDRLTDFSIITVSVLLLASVGCVVTALVFALKRRSSASLRTMGAGFAASLVSYIIGFVNAMSIRSSYLDDGFPEDKCHLSASPLAMIAVCAAAACVCFLAARKLDEEAEN